jgi:glutamate racemase
MRNPNGPIGLFDSGVGGGTVLAEVRRQLPHENLLYLADQARCPYGTRPIAELQVLALSSAEWLIAHGAKLVVVACHSASAAALPLLREHFPEIAFVGMVPAVKPAVLATRTGVVGVLATPATIGGGLLRDVVERWANGVRIIAQPCAGLADAVEQGALNSPATQQLLEHYLRPLLAAGADTLVLGCTHYPFLADQIHAIVGPHVALINPAPAVARQTARILHERGLVRQSAGAAFIRYATTGNPATFAALIATVGLPNGSVNGVIVGKIP